MTHPPLAVHPPPPPSLLSVVIWFGFGIENGNGIAPSMNIKGACRVASSRLPAPSLPRWYLARCQAVPSDRSRTEAVCMREKQRQTWSKMQMRCGQAGRQAGWVAGFTN